MFPYPARSCILQILQQVVDEVGYSYERLDGTITSASERQVIVDRFNADPSKLGKPNCFWMRQSFIIRTLQHKVCVDVARQNEFVQCPQCAF